MLVPAFKAATTFVVSVTSAKDSIPANLFVILLSSEIVASVPEELTAKSDAVKFKDSASAIDCVPPSFTTSSIK